MDFMALSAAKKFTKEYVDEAIKKFEDKVAQEEQEILMLLGDD